MKLQFNKHMSPSVITELTSQAIRNIIFSYEQSIKSVRVTDLSDGCRRVDLQHLVLSKKNRVELLLDLRLPVPNN